MTDDRLKIYHFTQSIDGFNDFRKTDILWPCAAYKACIPIRDDKPINIFEETVLRLTELLTGNAVSLAKVSCINIELIRFIQNRLLQAGYLDIDFGLTDSGKKIISELHKEPKPDRFIPVTVYLDLINGQWLPYLAVEELPVCEVENIEKNKVTFTYGARGKPKRVKAHRLSPVLKQHGPPAPEDIIKTAREYIKRRNRRSAAGEVIGGKTPVIDSSAVAVTEAEAENIYLHCMVLRSDRNDEWLVTEGFSGSFSAGFGNYIITQDFAWMHYITREAIVEGSQTALKAPKTQRHKYPDINRHLNNAEKEFKEVCGIDANSTNDDIRVRRALGNAVTGLYNTLEWTFRLLAGRYPAEDWRGIFAKGSKQENGVMLSGLARKTGLIVDEQVQYLLNAEPSRFRNAAVELQAGLALTVSGAAHDTGHPLLRLAMKEPRFLYLLSDLHAVRNQHSHGKSVTVNAEWFGKCLKTAKNAISILIPDFFEECSSADETASAYESYYQIRLQAENRLNKDFGIPFMQSAPKDVRNTLFEAKMLELEHPGDDTYVQRIINDMASALQSMIAECLSSRAYKYDVGDAPKEIAYARAAEAGFELFEGDGFPSALGTVAMGRIAKACKGGASTLGGVTLALCLMYSDIDLSQTAQKDPRLLKTAAELIEYRGHGNQSVLHVETSDMSSLWVGLVHTLKSLKE